MTASKPRNWKRIGKWTFWITNIVGVIIAIPILTAVGPLLKVYWTTRSEAAVESNQTFQTNQSLVLPNIADQQREPISDNPLESLETQLDQIADLDRNSIDEIIAEHFGPATESNADPAIFDDDSAVFEDINKVIREIEGERYHIYILELKDRNGNLSTRLAAYKKPNADYERSMQTMKLVQSNSQLKSVYDAFSHILASMAEEQDAPPEDTENEEIEIELVPILEENKPPTTQE
jgi:hypothetical protein